MVAQQQKQRPPAPPVGQAPVAGRHGTGGIAIVYFLRLVHLEVNERIRSNPRIDVAQRYHRIVRGNFIELGFGDLRVCRRLGCCQVVGCRSGFTEHRAEIARALRRSKHGEWLKVLRLVALGESPWSVSNWLGDTMVRPRTAAPNPGSIRSPRWRIWRSIRARVAASKSRIDVGTAKKPTIVRPVAGAGPSWRVRRNPKSSLRVPSRIARSFLSASGGT